MNGHDLTTEFRTSLATALDGYREIAFLDFPSHMNVGDTMIWLGTKRVLRDMGVVVRYISDAARYDAQLLRRLHPQGPILLHGGGNFGDLWPEFHEFRLRVIANHPDRRIVQAPQSVYFTDGELAARSDRHISQHPDFHLMCRDADSILRARLAVPSAQTMLSPDAAYSWRPREAECGRNNVVVLLRTDHEAPAGASRLMDWCQRNLPHETVFADWGLTGWGRTSWAISRVPGRIARLSPRARRSMVLYLAIKRGYEKMAHLNSEAGIRLMEGARLVITNRLHAHVLAASLGIEHVVVDNIYGKIASVASHSLEWPGVHYFPDSSGAIDWLNQRAEG